MTNTRFKNENLYILGLTLPIAVIINMILAILHLCNFATIISTFGLSIGLGLMFANVLKEVYD